MKTIAFAAPLSILAGALALAACTPAEETTAVEPGDTAETTESTTIINEAPPATDPVMIDNPDAEGSSLTIDGKDVDATVGEDGVQANIEVD